MSHVHTVTTTAWQSFFSLASLASVAGDLAALHDILLYALLLSVYLSVSPLPIHLPSFLLSLPPPPPPPHPPPLIQILPIYIAFSAFEYISLSIPACAPHSSLFPPSPPLHPPLIKSIHHSAHLLPLSSFGPWYISFLCFHIPGNLLGNKKDTQLEAI